MRPALLAVIAAALMAPAASAATGHEGDVADALGSDPVYVAPSRADVLSPADAGLLRLLIVKQDIGRIKIAVVPRSWAQQSGGVGRFTNGVDQAMDLHGALLVVADDARHDDVHVTTSHVHVDEVVAGVQHAFDGGGSLEQKLARSVRALANADPGPSGDQGAEVSTPTITIPNIDPNRITRSVGHAIELTTLIIVLVVLAPFIAFGGWLAVRARRGRREQREAFSDDLDALKQERAALGDDIVDLDELTSGADVSPGARSAYEKALDAYDRSEQQIAKADSPRRLAAAKQLVADGRQAAAQARASAAPAAPAG